jgi:hypothetical protein
MLKSYKMPVMTEYQECKAFYKWACTQPRLRDSLIKLANEDKRAVVSIFGLYAIGFRPGIPDYVLPIKTEYYGSLWLEMKRRKGYVINEDQRRWVGKLRELGNCAMIVHGWEQARTVTLNYIAGKRILDDDVR